MILMQAILFRLVFIVVAVIIDLQLNLEIGDTNDLIVGQVIPFSITVTNLGPNAAGVGSTSTYPNTVFTDTLLENSDGLFD